MTPPGGAGAPVPQLLKRRRLLKITAALASLLLLAVVLLPLLASTESARAEAERRASLALGRPVGVRSIRLSLLTGPSVTLQGVTVGNPPGAGWTGTLGEIREVQLDLALSSLWSRRVTVQALKVSGADLRLVRRADGRMNLQAWNPTHAGTTTSGMLAAVTAPLLLQVDRIVFEDLKISMEEQPSGLRIQAAGISLDARVSELPLEKNRPLLETLQHTALEGGLRLGSLKTEGMTLEGLRCRLLLEGGVAHLDGGEAKLNGGPLRFDASGNLQDATHPAFTFQGDLEKVQLTREFGRIWLTPFLAGFSGLLEGEIVRAHLEMSWKGLTPREIHLSLAGKGDMALSAGLDLGSLLPPDLPLALPPELTRFTQASARFRAGGGLVKNVLKFESADSAAEMSGMMRLGDLESDYILTVSGQLAKFLPARKVHLTGPITHLRPQYGEIMLDKLKDLLKVP